LKKVGFLGGGFSPTYLKHMRKSNWMISPSRDEHKTYLKPPTIFPSRNITDMDISASNTVFFLMEN